MSAAELPEPFRMRAPCGSCGCLDGDIVEKGKQDCVYCCSCGKWCYNAPRVETGKKVRTVTTVHNGIKPKQRVRVLQRATGRCELCGSSADLHVGHLVSVNRGLEHGLTEVELNDDENLCAMCAECNLGLGEEPVPLRVAIAIHLARFRERSNG